MGFSAVIILLAAALTRLRGFQAGLPGLGLSPDEGTVVPLAMSMVERGSLNPDWFLYPSLFLALTAGVIVLARPVMEWLAGVGFASPEAYAVDPTPFITAGRLISFVAGLAVVIAAGLLGRRVGGNLTAVIAAGLIALAPVTVAYSHIAVTDMLMLALLTFGLWQLVVAAQERSCRALYVAAALIGLGASAKYNAGFATLPAIGVALALGRDDRLRRAGVVAGISLGAFLVGTPFALLDPGTFLSDFWRQNRIVADGWLGFEDVGPGWWFNLGVLWDAVAPVALIAAGIGIAWAMKRRRAADWVLLPYALTFFVYISLWNAHFDRYLLPIIPVVAVYAGEAVRGVGEIVARRWPRALSAVVGVGIAGIMIPAGAMSVNVLDSYRQPELRETALPELARILPAGALIAVDPLTPRLRDAQVGLRLERAGVAGEWYRITHLATPQPGRRADRNRDVTTLRSRGVQWVLTSDDIERRVRAAPARYPNEMRFYRELNAEARRAMTIPPSLGPGVTVWELPPVS